MGFSGYREWECVMFIMLIRVTGLVNIRNGYVKAGSEKEQGMAFDTPRNAHGISTI